MRFNTKAEYGLAAIADIAIQHEQGKKAVTAEIAKRQRISPKYLEQILLQLRRSNLISASKGKTGGYSLSRDASKIRITDVLNALDSSSLADASELNAEDGIRMNLKVCLWDKINDHMRAYMDSLTLAELLAQCDAFESHGCYAI